MYKDFSELSVKQLVIQSNPISFGQVRCGTYKANCCFEQS